MPTRPYRPAVAHRYHGAPGHPRERVRMLSLPSGGRSVAALWLGSSAMSIAYLVVLVKQQLGRQKTVGFRRSTPLAAENDVGSNSSGWPRR
jgi:hypothetical protein